MYTEIFCDRKKQYKYVQTVRYVDYFYQNRMTISSQPGGEQRRQALARCTCQTTIWLSLLSTPKQVSFPNHFQDWL